MTSTNPELQGLIQELKKKSIEGNVSFWKKVAIDLEKPDFTVKESHSLDETPLPSKTKKKKGKK